MCITEYVSYHSSFSLHYIYLQVLNKINWDHLPLLIPLTKVSGGGMHNPILGIQEGLGRGKYDSPDLGKTVTRI